MSFPFDIIALNEGLWVLEVNLDGNVLIPNRRH